MIKKIRIISIAMILGTEHFFGSLNVNSSFKLQKNTFLIISDFLLIYLIFAGLRVLGP